MINSTYHTHMRHVKTVVFPMKYCVANVTDGYFSKEV